MLDLSDRIAEGLDEFIGRDWALSQFNMWLENTEPRIFLLTGAPGTGKSAIATQLVRIGQGEMRTVYPRLVPGYLTLSHFCQALSDTDTRPLRFIEALAEQLASRYPRFQRAMLAKSNRRIVIKQKVQHVADGGKVIGAEKIEVHVGAMPFLDAFDELVRKPLEQLCKSDFQETILILIDGLDEALTYNIHENIITLIRNITDHPRDLPRQVRLILTSRNDSRVLKALDETYYQRLDLIHDAPSDVNDLLAYVHRRLSVLTAPPNSIFANKIAESSEGNFLYARYTLDNLLSNPDQINDQLDLRLPRRLDGIYQEFLKREVARTDKDWNTYEPLLGALTVARGSGLTPEQLTGVLVMASGEKVTKDELIEKSRRFKSHTQELLRVCAQYVTSTQTDRTIQIYHHSFREYLLSNQVYQVDTLLSNQNIAEFFLAKYHGEWLNCIDNYALLYTPSHLIAALIQLSSRRSSKLRANSLYRKIWYQLLYLLTDNGFQKARIHHLGYLGIEIMLEDIDAALKLAPGGLTKWFLKGHHWRLLLRLFDQGSSMTPMLLDGVQSKVDEGKEISGLEDMLTLVSYSVRGMFVRSRYLLLAASSDDVYRLCTQIANKGSSLYRDRVWLVRGMVDHWLNGVGLRQEQNSSNELKEGDMVACWCVEKIVPGSCLLLESQMRLPGRAWIQFEVRPAPGDHTMLVLTDFFAPKIGTLGEVLKALLRRVVLCAMIIFDQPVVASFTALFWTAFIFIRRGLSAYSSYCFDGWAYNRMALNIGRHVKSSNQMSQLAERSMSHLAHSTKMAGIRLAIASLFLLLILLLPIFLMVLSI